MAKSKPEAENIYFDLVSSNGGRPKKIINAQGIEAIEKLSLMMCTDEEIASFLGLTVDTLTNKNNGEIFAETKNKGQCNGRISLRRMQLKCAEKGNTSMLIWLGKQHLNQKEQQEVSVNDSNISFTIKPASERPPEE